MASATVDIPTPPPLVSRAELLLAIANARSAYAAGQPDVAEGLAGRRFAVRQTFGCDAVTDPDLATGPVVPGNAGWSWGRDRQTIDIKLTPADLTASPVLAGDNGWEAAEGYWLARPWLKSEGCPTPPADSTSGAASSAPRAGLAAVFGRESSRVRQRDGRAFTWTLRGDPPVPPANGYRLVIEGRFSAFPSGRAIRCHSPDIDQEPICIAAAEVDRVAFEDSEGRLLQEWRLG